LPFGRLWWWKCGDYRGYVWCSKDGRHLEVVADSDEIAWPAVFGGGGILTKCI
jgi:hypothetical protein